MEVNEYRVKNICSQTIRPDRLDRLILSIFICLFGLGTFTQAQSTVQANLPADDGNYKIGVGDVLKILVLKQDILSQDNIRVSNEGTVRMPMLDEAIPAACLTEAQLSSEITNRYKKFLLNPQVYVTVREFNANPVAVIGAVNDPKTFQLQRPTRLFQILSQVNGPAANAGQFVQIFRDPNVKQCEQTSIKTLENTALEESSEREIISLSLPELLKGDESANPFVQGGDVIRVTEAELKQAFIIGNVKSAVTINLKEPVTLSRAIAMAGGFAPGAQTDKIKISRQSPDKTEIVVNLKDKNKRLNQEDIVLQPNDIVDVPGPKRSILKDIIRTIVPAVTRVPVILP
jgi:polysaccharide export outer membrane protein